MSTTTPGRVLALDVGERRIGVALSDPDRIIASGQPTLNAKPLKQALEQIQRLIEREQVTQVVIGLPLTLRGEVGPQAEVIHRFVAELKKSVSVPVHLQDERLTSVAADRSLEAMGVRRNKRREHIDQLAAVLILQSYLDTQRMQIRPSTTADADYADDYDDYDEEQDDYDD